MIPETPTDYRTVYNGSDDIFDLIEEAIQTQVPVMLFYHSRTRNCKIQTYIVLPTKFRIVSSKSGQLDLMLLAKQLSRRMRIVQFVMDRIYAVRSGLGTEETKEAGVTALAIDQTATRRSFRRWSHFKDNE